LLAMSATSPSTSRSAGRTQRSGRATGRRHDQSVQSHGGATALAGLCGVSRHLRQSGLLPRREVL
jgi:hypothetical protein